MNALDRRCVYSGLFSINRSVDSGLGARWRSLLIALALAQPATAGLLVSEPAIIPIGDQFLWAYLISVEGSRTQTERQAGTFLDPAIPSTQGWSFAQPAGYQAGTVNVTGLFEPYRVDIPPEYQWTRTFPPPEFTFDHYIVDDEFVATETADGLRF